MATTIQLTDPVSTLVTKTNDLIGEVGNLGNLQTTADGNLVAAINEIFNASQDSAEIVQIINNHFSASGGANVLDAASISADSADIGVLDGITLLTNTSLTLTNAKLFTIKNSAGANILAGYLLSTSSAGGTP